MTSDVPRYYHEIFFCGMMKKRLEKRTQTDLANRDLLTRYWPLQQLYRLEITI